MIKPKEAMNSFKKLMGEDFICTWFAAQCSLSGSRGQSLHLDYPYVSHNIPGEKIPEGMGSENFLLSCGILTFLNEYDKDYKGPILLKNSHKLRRFPTIEDLKKNNFTNIKVPQGSILIINTLVWHAGMPNFSKKKDRHLLVAHYTPKFVKLRYDLAKETNMKLIKKDNVLKKLLDCE
jgi:ectoine hydroxylase-related dioxygenase (phytanoyl-CoA dioxygenase family)